MAKTFKYKTNIKSLYTKTFKKLVTKQQIHSSNRTMAKSLSNQITSTTNLFNNNKYKELKARYKRKNKCRVEMPSLIAQMVIGSTQPS